MAVLALFAVGGLVGGSIGGTVLGMTAASIGGAIGASIGGVIDSQFVFPAIFGTGVTANGQRVNDLQLQTATEGSPVNFCLGPENRVAGEIIWMTPLKESAQDAGGKGGGGLFGGRGPQNYTYSVSAAIAICEGPIVRVTKIWAESQVLYDVTVIDQNTRQILIDPRMTAITIYLGDNAQTPDPLMESYMGTGQVPAYRGVAYIVINNLQLADFGNRFPNINIQVEAETSLTLAQAFTILLERAGLSSTQFDVTQVSGCVRGYTLSGPSATVNAIQTLMNAYAVRVKDVCGKLVFFMMGNERQIPVPATDLAAFNPSDKMPAVLDFTDVPNTSLPTEVDVQFYDPTNDYQRSSQRAQTQFSAFVQQSVQSFDAPFVLDPADAQALAIRQLWTQWAERIAVELFLPPSYHGLVESDVLNVTYLGNSYNLRLKTVERGANFLLHCTGVVEENDTASVLSQADPARGSDGSTYQPNRIYQPADPLWYIMDLPALRSQDINQMGYYAAACSLNSPKWHGLVLYTSLDDSTWSQQAVVSPEGTIGATTSALASGPIGYWDRVNTVTITLKNGELTSTDVASVLAGANVALIGNEIIAFQTATLTGVSTYTLSNLLRGLRDTPVMGHTSSDAFVLLSPQLVVFQPLNTSMIGAVRYYDGVPSGGALANYSSQQITLTGKMLTPFAVCHVVGTRDTSNNLSVVWVRRSRDLVNVLYSVPLDEPVESYEIVFTISGVSISKFSSTPSYAYSAADRVTDGFVAATSASITIYQLSQKVGRGNQSTAITV